ncbi:hypothetical protein H6F89_09865 [Cyanobacteria bacterium FACHB-63]|nr:hypothetical protein [Cyanobacteria bacterium FACHB-63]
MIEIHKQYVFDENGTAIAVQIPIEQFEQVESILNKSGQVILMLEGENEDAAWLNSDLSNLGSSGNYEWQPGELEAGKPITFVPGHGLVIEE